MDHFSIFVTDWFGWVSQENGGSGCWKHKFLGLSLLLSEWHTAGSGNAEGRWGSLTFQAEVKGHTREGKPGALRSLLLFSLFPVFEYQESVEGSLKLNCDRKCEMALAVCVLCPFGAPDRLLLTFCSNNCVLKISTGYHWDCVISSEGDFTPSNS